MSGYIVIIGNKRQGESRYETLFFTGIDLFLTNSSLFVFKIDLWTMNKESLFFVFKTFDSCHSCLADIESETVGKLKLNGSMLPSL